MLRPYPILALLLALGACAHSGPSSTPAKPAATQEGALPTDSAQSDTRAQKIETEFADALVAPLADLNLVRTPIPAILISAQERPYGSPEDESCTGLSQEITALNRALGADLDTTPSADQPSLLERGSDLASNAVISAVRDSTTGVLPFRRWVRRLTGAEKHARAVIAAISAGAVRRAYLKGLGQAQGGPHPASPALQAAPEKAQAHPETLP